MSKHCNLVKIISGLKVGEVIETVEGEFSDLSWTFPAGVSREELVAADRETLSEMKWTET